MRIRRDLSVLVLGMSLLQFIMPQAPWAAQSYTIQELGVADAIRAAGPNLGGQVAVRSGFVSATSRRITPGGRAARDRRLALDENIKESEIDDAGEVDVVDGRSAGRGGTLDVDDYVSANGINDLGNV